jgi:predicted DNA-binding transcriptional regulator AlpA
MDKTIIKREIKPRMLSIEETASYVGIAAKTIRNRIGKKAEKPFPVKPKRIGGRVLFDIKDLDKYLDALPTT